MAKGPESGERALKETMIFEAGRKFGVRQVMLFLKEITDEPTLAEEIGKYVLPNRQWRRRFNKVVLLDALKARNP